mgnify:CR=1 FL=1
MLKTMVLCAGRHDVPANDGAIFPSEIDPLNVDGLQQEANFALACVFGGWRYYCCDSCGGDYVPVDTDAYYCPICGANGNHGWGDYYSIVDPCKLRLYVTGLSVALVAALNACQELGIDVELLHFDRASGDYYSQEVV